MSTSRRGGGAIPSKAGTHTCNRFLEKRSHTTNLTISSFGGFLWPPFIGHPTHSSLSVLHRTPTNRFLQAAIRKELLKQIMNSQFQEGEWPGCTLLGGGPYILFPRPGPYAHGWKRYQIDLLVWNGGSALFPKGCTCGPADANQRWLSLWPEVILIPSRVSF